MEFLSLAVDKLLEYTLAPLARQVGYVIFYRSNVKQLKDEAVYLQLARESVQHRVDAAIRNGEEIEAGVQKWIEEVDDIAAKAKELEKDEGHAKTGCSGRSFPNLRSRHKLSRSSKKVAEEVVKIKGKGQFDQVSYQTVPNLIGNFSSTTGKEEFGSRDSTLDAIMEALKDPIVNKIGVYGLGGVGKTTLVKEVAKKAQQLFDVVVMATITHNPEVQKIQGQIADMLGLTFNNEQSITGRAGRLHERLKKETNVLIILDDLWGELDWNEVGIPSPEEHKHNSNKISISSKMQQRSCKILMTSRDREVLSRMNTQKYFLVEVLHGTKAWELFKEKADLDESIASAELLSIARDVAKECGGLPIAIVTIASSLKNRNLSWWKNVLRQLKKPTPTDVAGMQALIKPIEVTYENLEDDILKSFFLLSSMMPSDFSNMDLFKYSVGLNLFKHIPKIDDAWNSFNSYICRLKDLCLLLDINSSKNSKMHDVVKDVAILLASRHQHLLVKRNEKIEEWPEEEQQKYFTTIILDYCDTYGHLERLDCPNLTIFLLYNKDHSLKLVDNFFEGIPGLKVLDLTNMKFECLPSSISLLTDLRTLCLDQCTLLDIKIIGELKGLKVLSLSKSDIKQLPRELEQLTQLQLLDLTGCYQLKFFPPNVLSSLKKLEELYMEDSFDQWDVNDPNNQQQSSASVAELNNLPCLTTLEVHIPDERMLPKDLLFERFQRYKILIGDVWDWSCEHESSRTLKLWLSTGIHSRYDIKRLMDTVEDLHFGKLKCAKNVLPGLNEVGLSKLKHLYVKDNDEIQYIIDSVGINPAIDLFPNLESMVLQNVMNLEKLCNGSLTTEPFSKLKIIKVKNCDILRSLFSASIARGLPQLDEIELEECYRMEGVVHDDEKPTGILQFPKLCSLTLRSLPQLLGFRSKANSTCNVLGTSVGLFCGKVMFPNLEKLIIIDVDKLNVIWDEHMTEDNTRHFVHDEMKEIWHSPIPDGSFCNLKTLKVANCKGISKVLPFNLLKLLNNLEELEVECCNSVEVVFDLERITKEERDAVAKCLLRKLILTSLPILKHVWNKDPQGILDFQNLSIITATDCQSLKYLLPASVAKALPQLQELRLDSCTRLENIVAKEEGLDASICFMFPKVTLMWLWDLPKLKDFYPGRYTTEWPQLRDLYYVYLHKEVNIFGSKLTRIRESHCEDGPEASVQQPCSVEKAIPNLQELTLDCNESLMTWMSDFSESYFSKIKILRLQFFEEVQMTFPYSLFQRMSNVETLVVACNSFEEIFSYEKLASEGTQHGNAVQVKVLLLEQLPKLKQIGKEGYEVDPCIKNLQELNIKECSGLLNLVPSSVAFNHLTSLGVYKCEGLLYLLASSTAKSLGQLAFMVIEECKMIKEIVADKINVDTKTLDHEITFSKMKNLELKNLPLLESFCSANYAFKFPYLDNALICECPNLKIFSKRIPVTPKLWNVQVEEGEQDWYWEGDLNRTVQKMYANKVGLRSFELLKQAEFPELRELWHGQVSTKEFKNLRSVVVDGCEFLSTVVPFSVLKALLNLEELEVQNCSNAEVVFHLEGKDIDEKNVILTTKLKKLILSDLPNLKHVWNRDHRTVTFQNLRVVHALQCQRLSYLFPANVAKSLTQLEELKIDSCGFEEIVAKEEGQAMSVSFVFPKLTSLTIWSVPELKNFYPEEHTVEWPVLKTLNVSTNSEVNVFGTKLLSSKETHGERILDTSIQQPIFLVEKVFPNLESLTLNDKDDIMDWLCQFPIEHFHRLKILGLQCFNEEQDSFPYWLVQRIPNLEELVVAFSNFKEIFSNGGEQTNDHLQLKVLSLQELPKLEHICKEDNQLDTCLRSLQYLSLQDCAGLINLVPSSVSFNHLENLEICKCDGLLHLITSSTAKGLFQLTRMKIKECCMIKEIVPNEADDEAGDEIIFSNLKILELQQLSSLISFSSGNYEFKFPSLENVTVSQCPYMKTFSQGIPNTPKMQRVQGEDQGDGWYWEGNLNATIHKMYTEMVGIRSFELSKLSEFPELEKVWHSQVYTKEFKHLTSLVVDWCAFLSNVIPFNVLKSLINLEELEIKNNFCAEVVFDLEGINIEETNVVLVSRLRKLTLNSLSNLKHVWNKDPQGVVSFQNLQVVSALACQSLTSLFPANIAKGLMQLQELNIHNCGFEEIVAKEEGQAMSVSFVFPKLTSLKIWNVPKLKSFYPGEHTVEWPVLKTLNVYINSEVNVFGTKLFSYKETHQEHGLDISIQLPIFLVEKVFPNLEQLSLNNTDSIINWLDQFSMEHFQRLKILGLYYFDEEQASIPYWILQRMPNLEDLALVESSFSEIFPDEKYVVEGDQSDGFVLLKYLTLYTLPKLEHICKEGSKQGQYLMNLQSLYVAKCQRLVNLVPSSVSFKHLAYLEVCDCYGLLYLITSSTAKSLAQLTTMKIRECSMIEEIVASDTDEGGDVITFTKLEILKLQNLSSLRSFCSRKYDFKFPCLKNVIVRQCPKMRTFSPELPSTPSLKRVKGEGDGSYWEGNLNASIHMIYTEMAYYHLEYISLSEYPDIKEVWPSQVPDESFRNLQTLIVSNCEGISKLLSFNLLESLNNLYELQVKDCNLLEVVFDLEGTTKSEGRAVPESHLRKLTLSSLPNLKQVWNKDPKGIVDFPSLGELNASECRDLKYLLPASVAKSLLQLWNLEMKSCTGLENIVAREGLDLDASINFMFPELQYLRLWNLPKLKSFYHGRFSMRCPKLRELTYVYIHKEVNIFESKFMTQESHWKDELQASLQQSFSIEKAMPVLHELTVDCNNTMMTWLAQFSADQINKLEILNLKFFHDVNTSFPYSFLQRLANVKILVVADSSFEEIFPLDKQVDEGNQSCSAVQVEMLTLEELPKLRHICKDGCKVDPSLRNLKQLHVKDCSGLLNLVPSSVLFNHLTILKVCKCEGLLYLMASSTARSLTQLTTMVIEECRMIKEIVAGKVADDEAINEITFSNLKAIKLQNLPCLESFCSRDYGFKFPSLENVVIFQCSQMKIFTKGDFDTPNLQNVQTDQKDDGYWDDNHNLNIQKLYANKGASDKLRKEVYESKDNSSSQNSSQGIEHALPDVDTTGQNKDQIQIDKGHMEGDSGGNINVLDIPLPIDSHTLPSSDAALSISPGLHAQSKDENTDAKANTASLPVTGSAPHQNQQNALEQGMEATIQDSSRTTMDTSDRDAMLDQSNKDYSHERNQGIVSGHDLMDSHTLPSSDAALSISPGLHPQSKDENADAEVNTTSLPGIAADQNQRNSLVLGMKGAFQDSRRTTMDTSDGDAKLDQSNKDYAHDSNQGIISGQGLMSIETITVVAPTSDSHTLRSSDAVLSISPGLNAQSKDENTDAEANSASLPVTGFGHDQNQRNALGQRMKGIIEDSPRKTMDSSDRDAKLAQSNNDYAHDSNQGIVSGRGLMSIETSTVVAPTSGASTHPANGIQMLVSVDFRKFKEIAELNEDNIALLEEVIAKYPHLWEASEQLSARFYGWAYKTLLDLLYFLRTESVMTLTKEREQEFHVLCNEAIRFGFNVTWVEELRKRVTRDPEVNHAMTRLMELRKEMDRLNDFLLTKEKCFDF